MHRILLKIQGNLTKISLSAVGCYSFKRPVKIAAVQSYTVSKTSILKTLAHSNTIINCDTLR